MRLRASLISVVIAVLSVVSSASSTAPWQAKPKPKADAISGAWEAVLTTPDKAEKFTFSRRSGGARVPGASVLPNWGEGAIRVGRGAKKKLKVGVETRHGLLALTGALRNGKLAGEWDM